MFNYCEKNAIMDLSQGSTGNFESAISGENNRAAVPEMVTQSLLQSKDLITSNNNKASESLDSAVLCVGGIEGKKQRIGVRLSIGERKAIENAASQNQMKLSDYIRTSLIKNIAA